MIVRELAAWAPKDTTPLALLIVKRALCDVGICEIPPGSNRSGRIDEYVEATGSPLGSYWCAAALTAWFREAGAKVPLKNAASCDAWMAWGKDSARWTFRPEMGHAVVYGKGDDASHIGVVVRVEPILLSVEGNAAFEGYSRNGVAVDLRPVRTMRVLGYIAPEAAA